MSQGMVADLVKPGNVVQALNCAVRCLAHPNTAIAAYSVIAIGEPWILLVRHLK